jgi:hypothetical protein
MDLQFEGTRYGSIMPLRQVCVFCCFRAVQSGALVTVPVPAVSGARNPGELLLPETLLAGLLRKHRIELFLLQPFRALAGQIGAQSRDRRVFGLPWRPALIVKRAPKPLCKLRRHQMRP